mmetsp:Transcript_30499/g.71164  ORF Transcript_30499/g.71164 Transcript_30499/m.71164 type:complete len:1086 (-) Transcript_30499:52-3309(-)
MAAAQQVIAHIHGLHTDFQNTAVHSKWLEQFQVAPEAWPVALEILMGSSEEVVLYFAAHTVVTKMQAGQLPAGSNSILQDLIGCLVKLMHGPRTVRRQLVVGIVDYQLWRPPQEDMAWFHACTQKLSEGGEASVGCLLEFLVALPEEAINKKVLVSGDRRISFAGCMLQCFSLVLDALVQASQRSSDLATSALILKALARWLSLQHADPVVRAAKKAGRLPGQAGQFSADVLTKQQLHQHSLVQQACNTVSTLASAPLELCTEAAEVLIEILGLTNETSASVRPVQLAVLQAVVVGAGQLVPAYQAYTEKFMPSDTPASARAAILGRLVSESAFTFTRLLLQDKHATMSGTLVLQPVVMQETEACLQKLAEIALHLLVIRHTQTASYGLDFWYSVLSVHFGALADGDDPFDEDSQKLQARPSMEAEVQAQQLQRQRMAQERPILAPFIQGMVKALWRTLRFPGEPELEENFEWDEHVRFRETASINITEACVIVNPQWIIEYIGVLLEEICTKKVIAWQDIDACIFVLTGVASRAPAGQDTVIPRLIELLPQLPYPTDGFKAVLMRAAAARLVLFTTGYLAQHSEPCKNILRFMTTHLLPVIPELSSAPDLDPDAKKYLEAMSADGLKTVMTNARQAITLMDGGTFWRDIISVVSNLVSESRFGIDARAQMVFGIGQVLSALQDWEEIEQTLGLLVKRTEAFILPIMQKLPPEPLGMRAVKLTKDGKAPPELKLYIASVSCVYNMPARNEELPRPPRHPVLAVFEQNFRMIEQVCIHHTQYEELMEQVCMAFSYILNFCKEYVPESKLLVPMLQLIARCMELRPQPFYISLGRSLLSVYGDDETEGLPNILLDFCGVLIGPVVRTFVSEASDTGPPELIKAAAFDVLAELVRHARTVRVALQTSWFPELVEITVEAMPRLALENLAVHERTVNTMVRFLKNLFMWVDFNTANLEDPTLQPVSSQCKALWESQLPRGPLFARLLSGLMKLVAAAAQNNPARGEAVPAVSDFLRIAVCGQCEFEVYRLLPAALASLPSPLCNLFSEPERQRFIQQFKMDKMDRFRFLKTIMELAEKFSVAIKQAPYR